MFALGSQGWLPTASSPNWPSWSFGTLWDLPFPGIHPTPFLRSAFTPISTNFCTLSIPAPQSLRPLPWIFSFSFPPVLALEVRRFGCYLCDWFHLPTLLPVPQWSYNLYGRDLQRVTCIYPIANWNLKEKHITMDSVLPCEKRLSSKSWMSLADGVVGGVWMILCGTHRIQDFLFKFYTATEYVLHQSCNGAETTFSRGGWIRRPTCSRQDDQ